MTAPGSRAPACTTCVFCLREDYGYSNYTTEGTELHCLRNLNPALDGQEDPGDPPHQWHEVTPELAEALDVAKSCPSYREGAPVWLDCDREGLPYDKPVTVDAVKAANYTDDDDAAAAFVEWLGESK